MGNPHHFLNTGQGALAANALGAPWQGDYIFNTGDLVLDMLHNFFLECGARMGKLRVYESTDNPIARQMCGYLLTRGGVHQVAYAKALEKITGRGARGRGRASGGRSGESAGPRAPGLLPRLSPRRAREIAARMMKGM